MHMYMYGHSLGSYRHYRMYRVNNMYSQAEATYQLEASVSAPVDVPVPLLHGD